MGAAGLALAALAGWLLGSVPVAYLVVKGRAGREIHAEGSGNVGANNAFRTTGSRGVGVAVLVLDALKGALAVLAGWALGGGTFAAGAAGLFGAIAGHNYNLFLSLRAGGLAGGKGLAAAAGGLLLLMPGLVPAWLVLLVLGVAGFERLRGVRDVIPGNVFASALLPLVALGLYGPAGFAAVAAFDLLILPKHTAQMRALWRGPENGGR